MIQTNVTLGCNFAALNQTQSILHRIIQFGVMIFNLCVNKTSAGLGRSAFLQGIGIAQDYQDVVCRGLKVEDRS